jgi:hypothetical protein
MNGGAFMGPKGLVNPLLLAIRLVLLVVLSSEPVRYTVTVGKLASAR